MANKYLVRCRENFNCTNVLMGLHTYIFVKSIHIQNISKNLSVRTRGALKRRRGARDLSAKERKQRALLRRVP